MIHKKFRFEWQMAKRETTKTTSPPSDIVVRRLTALDVPTLAQIRPTYKSSTILAVEKVGSGLTTGWQLVERTLPQPFDKGTLYNFDENAQITIRKRLNNPRDTYQRVAEWRGQLIGLLEMEVQYWNETVMLWNLMIDLDFRRQGLGHRLWELGVDYARRASARAIMVETQNTNVGACQFYARVGCQLVGINEAYYANDALNRVESAEFALFWAYYL
jgi:streptothricin acetyltransferase